ncbi:WD40-repeat-containing domain protein [Syncephalis pseudoplumigaleata]|uniref:WD40-repeat-containing domain protein n=1 Tax=Syncephalis pseudoplumigaleata TaxID=1712513 RepID=A0A4P9Z3T8_9FUNG|nr:WD40-repeat-containing domain protein [Syncephalis pseudoplumigaleata]|eukprot:RKP26200.1 WD40-repeat-containing domain protein [Syncephalis pseudoplumigaleata]
MLHGSDNAFLLHSTPIKYPLRLTIQHWQLRDLLLCPFTRDELFVVNQNTLLRYCPHNDETSPVMKHLPFTPVSMAVGCGYVAAGGQRSQLSIRELDNNWCVAWHIGGTINNAIHISRHLDQNRIVVCNNDQTIKAFTLPDLNKVATVQLPVAVNHASISPDGRRMVAVGDSNEIFMFDVRSGGYFHTATLKGAEDAGFSTAWNRIGNQFVVASQDGRVIVWDIRSSEKLATLTCTQSDGTLHEQQPSRVRGAVRCVKFSQSGAVDLLAFSEHVNYVNVVDARTYQDRQSICIAPDMDAHIAGMDFSPCGTRLFVGTENSVAAFDVDVMARHRFAHGVLA